MVTNLFNSSMDVALLLIYYQPGDEVQLQELPLSPVYHNGFTPHVKESVNGF